MAELEARAEVATEQAEGRDHPSVPEDRLQLNFTDSESRIMPELPSVSATGSGES